MKKTNLHPGDTDDVHGVGQGCRHGARGSGRQRNTSVHLVYCQTLQGEVSAKSLFIIG